MCGRLTQLFNATALIPFFQTSGVSFQIDSDLDDSRLLYSPKFNAAPSERLSVLLHTNHEVPTITHTEMEWGLHSSPTKHHPKSFNIFNKRVETVSEKPFFKNLWKHSRLAVPVSGWYEWSSTTHRTAGRAIPHYFTAEQPLFLCGLWYSPETHSPETLGLKTNSKKSQFVILTTAASGPAQTIHARMPLILPKEWLLEWLQPGEITPNRLTTLLAHQKDLPKNLNIFPVSRHVNNARHKEARCIEATAYDEELTLFE